MMPPTREQAIAALNYNAETGQFLRIIPTARKPAGTDATIKSNGYRMVLLGGRCWHAHRLAWLISYGEWPSNAIDHANGDPSDNRIANLRSATPSQNGQNRRVRRDSQSGIKGISWEPGRRKWQAAIKVGAKRILIGRFGTAEEASEAYQRAARKHFGEFART